MPSRPFPRSLPRTALLAAGAALALPAAALAAQGDDPPSPREETLRAPVAGHLSAAAQMRAAGRAARHERLADRHAELARRVARVRDAEAPDGLRVRVAGLSPDELRERNAGLVRDLRAERRERERRRERREQRERAQRSERRAAREAVAVPPALEAIAACESGGDPTAIGGGGLYRGKYQFALATWQSVGGTGDPAAAPEAEQDRRAAALYARAGASPWPVCGR